MLLVALLRRLHGVTEARTLAALLHRRVHRLHVLKPRRGTPRHVLPLTHRVILTRSSALATRHTRGSTSGHVLLRQPKISAVVCDPGTLRRPARRDGQTR